MNTLLAILLVLLSIFSFNGYGEVRPEVKIGVIVPLSGDMAMHGAEIRNAMTLALEQQQKKNLTFSYHLLFSDNQLRAQQSLADAHYLIDQEKVDVVVTLWPPTAEVVLPVSEKAGVLHYTISWDPELVKKNQLLLSHQVLVTEIVAATLQLLQANGIRKIAFLHMNERGFNLGAQILKEAAAQKGITIVSEDTFEPEERDFSTVLQRSKQRRPDGYLLWAVLPALDVLLRKLKEVDPTRFVTGYFDYASSCEAIEERPYVSEIYASEDFRAQYRERFGDAAQSKAANAYDILNLIVAGYESHKSAKLSAADLKRRLLQNRQISGAVGDFSIDSFGMSHYAPMVRMCKNGERILLGKAVP